MYGAAGFSWTAVLNAAVNRKAAIKHRTPTTGAIPLAADIKRDALSIVEAREFDGASLWRSIVLQGLLLVGFREHPALKRVRTETAN